MTPSLLIQVLSLARRSTLRTLRQPAVLVSAIGVGPGREQIIQRYPLLDS